MEWKRNISILVLTIVPFYLLVYPTTQQFEVSVSYHDTREIPFPGVIVYVYGVNGRLNLTIVGPSLPEHFQITRLEWEQRMGNTTLFWHAIVLPGDKIEHDALVFLGNYQNRPIQDVFFIFMSMNDIKSLLSTRLAQTWISNNTRHAIALQATQYTELELAETYTDDDGHRLYKPEVRQRTKWDPDGRALCSVKFSHNSRIKELSEHRRTNAVDAAIALYVWFQVACAVGGPLLLPTWLSDAFWIKFGIWGVIIAVCAAFDKIAPQ